MKNCVLAVVLSAVVLFVWGFVSWTILPWHNMVANKLADESAVSAVLKENAPSAGVYYLPFAQEDLKPGALFAFANVLPDGADTNMGKIMGLGMLGQMVSALLVLLLLVNTSNLGYWERVRFVALAGVAIGFVSHFPYWNWFGFSTSYTLVIILDSLVAWLLAGLVMAKYVEGQST